MTPRRPLAPSRGFALAGVLGLGLALATWQATSRVSAVEQAPPSGSARDQAYARAAFQAALALGARLFAAVGAQHWADAYALMAPAYRATHDEAAFTAACRARPEFGAGAAFSLRALREEAPRQAGLHARVARGTLSSLAGTVEVQLDLTDEGGPLSVERLRVAGATVMDGPADGAGRLPEISR